MERDSWWWWWDGAEVATPLNLPPARLPSLPVQPALVIDRRTVQARVVAATDKGPIFFDMKGALECHSTSCPLPTSDSAV